MNNCTEAKNASRYFDGTLEGVNRTSFEQHLSSCDDCREALSDFHAFSEILAQPSEPDPSSELKRRALSQHFYDLASDVDVPVSTGFAYSYFATAAIMLISTFTFSLIVLRQNQSVNLLDEHLAGYIVLEPNPDLVEEGNAPDFENIFATWMAYSLSEDISND